MPSLFSLITFICKQSKFRSVKGYMEEGLKGDLQSHENIENRQSAKVASHEDLSTYSIYHIYLHYIYICIYIYIYILF